MPDIDVVVRTETFDPTQVVPLMERLRVVVADNLGYKPEDNVVKLTPVDYALGYSDIDVAVLTSPDNPTTMTNTETTAQALVELLRVFVGEIGKPDASVAAVVRTSAAGKCKTG